MKKLNIVCMLWANSKNKEKKYTAENVNNLEKMLKAEVKNVEPVLWCVTNINGDFSSTIKKIHLPNNVSDLKAQYPKLWLQSAEFAEKVYPEQQFLYTDLDVIITGDISEMISENDLYRFRANYLVPCQGPNYKFIRPSWLPMKLGPKFFHNRRKSVPFSTSFFWFTVGTLRHVWDSFDQSFSDRIIGWTGTDQKWMNYVLGSRVPFFNKKTYFEDLSVLEKQNKKPNKNVRVIICSHKTKPWNDSVRNRNTWIKDKYPI